MSVLLCWEAARVFQQCQSVLFAESVPAELEKGCPRLRQDPPSPVFRASILGRRWTHF